MIDWIIKKRRKYACKFGRIEHKAGRLLGWFLFINLFIACYYKNLILIIGILVTFITWLTYLIAHTFEKKLYGKFGFR